MVYTDEFARVELEFGEKMVTLLPRMMTLHGVSGAARIMGVDETTLWSWNRNRVKSKRVCVYVHDVDVLMKLLGYMDIQSKP